MPELTHLRLERPSDGVALVVLDNPELRNAMSDEMTASWDAAIDDLAADRSVRAVVVTGEGSAFCSGGNTGWIASEPDATVDYLRTRMIAFYRAWLSIRRLEVPTIAAVNGAAIGAGLCLALLLALHAVELAAPGLRHDGLLALVTHSVVATGFQGKPAGSPVTGVPGPIRPYDTRGHQRGRRSVSVNWA